jgi:hypothetical protein
LLISISKVIEKRIFTKTTKISDVREDDWLAKDVFVDNKLIVKATISLSKKEIEKLKQSGVKEVEIKEGMPFAPVFPIAIFFSLFVGDPCLIVLGL